MSKATDNIIIRRFYVVYNYLSLRFPCMWQKPDRQWGLIFEEMITLLSSKSYYYCLLLSPFRIHRSLVKKGVLKTAQKASTFNNFPQ